MSMSTRRGKKKTNSGRSCTYRVVQIIEVGVGVVVAGKGRPEAAIDESKGGQDVWASEGRPTVAYQEPCQFIYFYTVKPLGPRLKAKHHPLFHQINNYERAQ